MCKIHEIEWKPLVGHEDKFLISNRGFIFNAHTKNLVATRKDKNGYLMCDLYYNGKQSTHKIHRLVAINFIENPFDKETVNHKDGDKLNNSLENLEWLTAVENINHAYLTGLINNRGINNYKSLLTPTKVQEIRNLRGKLSQSKIGKLYGVSRGAVYNILSNNTWKP